MQLSLSTSIAVAHRISTNNQSHSCDCKGAAFVNDGECNSRASTDITTINQHPGCDCKGAAFVNEGECNSGVSTMVARWWSMMVNAITAFSNHCIGASPNTVSAMVVTVKVQLWSMVGCAPAVLQQDSFQQALRRLITYIQSIITIVVLAEAPPLAMMGHATSVFQRALYGNHDHGSYCRSTTLGNDWDCNDC